MKYTRALLNKLKAIDPQATDLADLLYGLEDEDFSVRDIIRDVDMEDRDQALEASDYVCPDCGVKSACETITYKIGTSTRSYEKRTHCPCYYREKLARCVIAAEKKLEGRINCTKENSGITQRYMPARFDNYEIRPGTAELHRACKAWQYGETGLLLMGGFGCGKTHLASAIADATIRAGHGVAFRTVPKLLTDIKATYSRDNNDSEAGMLDKLIDVDLLILDDYGTEKVTDWVVEKLYLIIDGRYQAMKPTIYTTNLTLEQLETRMSGDQGKIIDRMLETCVLVDCKAPSYRETVKAPEVARKAKLSAN